MENTQVASLVYNGEIIRDRGDMLSLTDMWKSAGAPESKRPANWARKEGAEFIEHVGLILNMPMGHIETSRGGSGAGRGATFAHWQIGLAYAKYLSPEFHMWCNQVVRDRMEGKAAATVHGLTKYDVQIIGNVVKNCTGVVVKEQIAALLPTLIEPMVAARLAEQNFLLRRGKTAGQIWHEHGFPAIRVTSWFSNRLSSMGCQIEYGGRGELGLGTAKLFDPDKASVWLRNGGRALVNEYVARRMGQGRLHLVGKAA